MTNTTQVITHRKDPQEDALVGRGFSPKCSGNRLFPGRRVETSWQDILDRIGELILRSSYNQHNDDAITNYRPQLDQPSPVITCFYNNPPAATIITGFQVCRNHRGETGSGIVNDWMWEENNQLPGTISGTADVAVIRGNTGHRSR